MAFAEEPVRRSLDPPSWAISRKRQANDPLRGWFRPARDVRAIHHASHLFLRSQGKFGIELLRAEIDFHRAQFRLRLLGQHVVDGRRLDSHRRRFAAAAQPSDTEDQQEGQRNLFHAATVEESGAVFNLYERW